MAKLTPTGRLPQRHCMNYLQIAVLASFAACVTTAFTIPPPIATTAEPSISHLSTLRLTPTDDSDIAEGTQNKRRDLLQKSLTFGALLTAPISSAYARNSKSRTTGYEFQKIEVEWSQLLSPQQYFILRQGGTESPYSSVLEGEERSGSGIYACAGCGTPLFDANEKFHSGT